MTSRQTECHWRNRNAIEAGDLNIDNNSSNNDIKEELKTFFFTTGEFIFKSLKQVHICVFVFVFA